MKFSRFIQKTEGTENKKTKYCEIGKGEMIHMFSFRYLRRENENIKIIFFQKWFFSKIKTKHDWDGCCLSCFDI